MVKVFLAAGQFHKKKSLGMVAKRGEGILHTFRGTHLYNLFPYSGPSTEISLNLVEPRSEIIFWVICRIQHNVKEKKNVSKNAKLWKWKAQSFSRWHIMSGVFVIYLKCGLCWNVQSCIQSYLVYVVLAWAISMWVQHDHDSRLMGTHYPRKRNET